ncbi:MAG: minor capsid protein [Chloroflexi bacterium]|nr:minor capsid protein [Chloroflexota bacterium]
MAEPDVYDLADEFRRQLLQGERAAATELVRAYGQAWQHIRGRLDALAQQIAAARARGEEVSLSWLFQQERLQTLQRQVEAEIRDFSRFAEGRILQEQAQAVQAAQDQSAALMRAGLGPAPEGVTVTLARLPAGAVQDLVGFLQDGSPLRELLDELGPEASTAVRQALITGVATGQGPRQIARQVRQSLGGNLVRALTISRTEVLRSYRESSRRTYEANSDVVSGWVWHSALGTRTCAFCWSMHGSVHPVTERMATHANCRCAEVPRTKSWEDLGFKDIPDTRPDIRPGTELFRELSEAEQLKILGPAKLAAYRAGALKLEDLRGFRRDPRWGPVGFERSLKDILGEKRAEAYTRLARLAPGAGGAISDADRLILEAATGARTLTREELHQVLEHVARAGFPTGEPSDARGLSGIEWQGRILRGRDTLTAVERHYLRHVVARREWPDGTTLAEYEESIRRVILDEGNGVFTSQFLQSRQERRWQLGVVAPSGDQRGPGGAAWILVDYRVGVGWMTAHQLPDINRELQRNREGVRWLRPLPR